VSISLQDLDRARRDPAMFAEMLVGQALWSHQLEVVRSLARYRVINAGRRAGKTRVFGVLSLHETFKAPRRKVLIVSAGDIASKRMFADIAGMAAGAPLLRGSVADETKSLLTLTNGSTIECVPQSMGQVRSAEADLLIVDEAGFVAQGIWEAAEPVVVARAGSRVLICSTPWGAKDHFFRVLWRQGMDRPDTKVESWHWPSTVSPLVDVEFLEDIKGRSSPLYFAREYMAEFVDEAGAYFRSEELDAALDDYELVDPVADVEAARACGTVVGGVDWGGRRDAHALVVVAGLAETDGRGRRCFWLPWVEARYNMGFDEWLDRLLEVAGDRLLEVAGELLEVARAFSFVRLMSEENGVGMAPTASLQKLLWEHGVSADVVEAVTTTARLKENGFGFVRLLLQQGRLRLPRHPELLKQLAALEYEMTESGLLRISVPERVGHDDLAMALCMAVLPLIGGEFVPEPPVEYYDTADLLGEEFEEGLPWSISPY
jgi:Terminase large subunit, T4likevirus-type, N-terminal